MSHSSVSRELTSSYAPGMANVRQIRPGLWRWTAPHPEWRPGAAPGSPADWSEEVGSVLCELPDATVLIDALLPPEPDALLEELDRHIHRRGLPVAALTTIKFHRRSRDVLVDRYEASTSRARKALPAGMEALPIAGAGETIFWLPGHRSLVPGDRIIGDGRGGLRLCPESWLRYLPSGLTQRELAVKLRPLLDLPIEHMLVSHGEPVIGDGRAALWRALA